MRDIHESLTTTKEHTLIHEGPAFGTATTCVTTTCIEHNQLATHCSESLSVQFFVFLVVMITLLHFPKKIGETLYNVVHVLSMCLLGSYIQQHDHSNRRAESYSASSIGCEYW